MDFVEWFTPKMQELGYKATIGVGGHIDYQDGYDELSKKGFHLVYRDRQMSLENMQLVFKAFEKPVLFIVDSDLVTDITVDEKWLRAIHALYYGRIYVWDGVGVSAIHHDRQSDTLSDGGYIEPDEMKFELVDCWYSGFPGTFNIARFDDPVFWKTEAKKDKPPPRQKDSTYEDFWKQEYQRQQANEDVFRDFREAYERNKRQYEANHPKPPPSRSRYQPTGDKWFMLMVQAGNLEGAKKVYRQLALEHHPDRKGDSPEVVQTMQLINAAWERAKEILV